MKTEKTEQTTPYRFSLATVVLAAVLGVSGVFCSCAKMEGELLPSDRKQIVLSASVGTIGIETEAQTRASVVDTDRLTLYFARADETASGIYGSYGTTALTATRTTGSGVQQLTFNPMQYYLSGGVTPLKTKFTGWYPQATSFADGVVSWTFSGSQDIMTAGKQEGTKITPMPNFVFNHRLTQLQFFPYADDERISQGWGKIMKIEVLTQANKATYTLSTEAIAFSGSTTLSAGIAATGVALPASKIAATMMGNPVMIAPQSSDSYTLTLKVTTEHQGVKTVPLISKFEAGIPYRIYLRFVDLEMSITPEVAITDWTGQNINVEY